MENTGGINMPVTGNKEGLKQEVLDKLEEISRSTGKTVYITSGYREGDPRNHGKGIAVDIHIDGMDSVEISRELEKVGFTGLGQYYNYDDSMTNFAHGDLRDTETKYVQIEDAPGSRKFIKWPEEPWK